MKYLIIRQWLLRFLADRSTLFAVSFLLLSACVQKPYVLPPPPTETVRAELGTVGLASAQIIFEHEFRTPAKGSGSGAGRGAGLGAGTMIAAGAYSGGAGIILGVLLAPVGAVGGAIYGASAAIPAAEVEAAETTLTKAVAEYDFQEAIRRAVFDEATAQTRHAFLLSAGWNPQADVPAGGDPAPGGEPAHTVLELGISKVALDGPWSINPPLVLVMHLEARLVRMAGGEEIYSQKLTYAGPAHTFTEWAAHDARGFREGLETAIRTLAEKAVEEIFLLYLPETAGDAA